MIVEGWSDIGDFWGYYTIQLASFIVLARSCLLDIRPFVSQVPYRLHLAKMSSLHLPLCYFDLTIKPALLTVHN